MPKIMLVEDDNNLREIYGERLMAEGYEIIAANDGEEALALAVKEKPDLIISDVMMPKISGFDMLDILRQTPETKNTKVIMMTALSQTEDKDRADRLGADKYLVKSQVTLEDVARVVHDMLYAPTDASEPADSGNVAPVADAQVTTQATATVTQSSASTVDPAADINAVLPATPIEDTTASAIEEPKDQPEATLAEDKTEISEPAVSATETPESIPSEPVVSEPATPPATTPKAATEPEEVPAKPLSEPAEPIKDTTTPVKEESSLNPISGETVQSEISNTNSAGSASAASTDEELDTVNKTIENFVNNNNDNPEETQAPLVEPTEQQLIHAQNAAEDPKVEQPAVEGGMVSAPSSKSDPSVPPVIEEPENDVIEPASARKKVIMPPEHDSSEQEHDINELYKKEIAQETMNTPVENPPSGSMVDASSNPITNTSETEKPLETIDTSQISGLSYGDDQVVPAPQENETPATQSPQMPPVQGTGTPTDPHSPDQIAL